MTIATRLIWRRTPGRAHTLLEGGRPLATLHTKSWRRGLAEMTDGDQYRLVWAGLISSYLAIYRVGEVPARAIFRPTGTQYEGYLVLPDGQVFRFEDTGDGASVWSSMAGQVHMSFEPQNHVDYNVRVHTQNGLPRHLLLLAGYFLLQGR